MFVIVAHHEVGVLWADLNVSRKLVKSGQLTKLIAAHFPSSVKIHVSQQMLPTSPAERNAMVVAECSDLSLSTISLHGSFWQLLLSLYLLGK